MGRAHTEANEELRQRIMEQFDTVIHRFLAALQKSTPELSPSDLGWGFFLLLGAWRSP